MREAGSLTLEEIDQAIAATEPPASPSRSASTDGSPRTSPRRTSVEDGGIGTPQLMRSITRDPGPAGSARAVPPWTIFRETLIHDFDTLLWLNPGARPVEVFTKADALVAPQYKETGCSTPRSW